MRFISTTICKPERKIMQCAVLSEFRQPVLSIPGITKCYTRVQSSTFWGSHSTDAVESQLLGHRLHQHGLYNAIRPISHCMTQPQKLLYYQLETTFLYWSKPLIDYRRSRNAPSFSLHLSTIYAVSQKNIPDVSSYNWRKHWWIFIIFGRNVTEKASNHMLLYFSISPN